MRLRSRIGTATAVAVFGVAGLLGLSACASGPGATGTVPVSAEADALTALGFEPTDVAPAEYAPRDDPSARPERKGDRGQHRGHAKGPLRRNMLHGEIVVQTKDGPKTVVVQRGTVTAVDDRSMTVKSTDGYTLTWTFGDKLRVVERRTTVQPSAIKVGTEVGVAGAETGDTTTARLVVVPPKK